MGGRALGGQIDLLDLRAGPMNPEAALGVLLGLEWGAKGAWPARAELKRAWPRVVLKTET